MRTWGCHWACESGVCLAWAGAYGSCLPYPFAACTMMASGEVPQSVGPCIYSLGPRLLIIRSLC